MGDWEREYREKFEKEHKGTITKTYAQLEKMQAEFNKNYMEPISKLGQEILAFQESVGISSQPKDMPEFDDPKAEEKMKVISARMEKAFAENESQFKEFEAQQKNLEAGMLQESQKIQKAADELKVYIKNKLANAGDFCPMCKGKGKIAPVSDEKRKVYEEIAMKLNFLG
jgi:hypothetical protein